MINIDTEKTKKFFKGSQETIVIDKNRKELLSDIAHKIADEYKSNNNSVAINFICTHNSRRSQIGQVWTFFAAHYFDLNITAYSGGTEVTAFFRNTVKTLKSVGFTFDVKEFSHQNPVYQISFEGTEDYILGFSKTYDHKINKAPYVAITTCDSADENCPFIAEASLRFHIPYTDPKHSDGTDKQEEVYLKTNQEIAAQVYFLFKKIKSLV